jgi:hypothetical protein
MENMEEKNAREGDENKGKKDYLREILFFS